ncbi:MAG: hypothetical protein IH614_13660, partial [Desulfuromonadales bacterium]|nr:hypothetical protein [Desulfuromonadales bacterium]
MKSILLVCTLVTVLFGCSPPVHYTAEELADRGVNWEQGVVTEQTQWKLTLLTESSALKTFETSGATQYLPESYRSMIGDVIRVAYQGIWLESGRVRLSVLQLQSVEVPDKNSALPGHVFGRVVGLGQRSAVYGVPVLLQVEGSDFAIPVYLPDNQKILFNQGPFARDSGELGVLVGNRAEVTMRRIPAVKGNSY